MDELDRCRRGHLWTKKNTRLCKRGTDPSKVYRRCRKCQHRAINLRYRNDAAYREKIKAKNLANYYKRKERACTPPP